MFASNVSSNDTDEEKCGNAVNMYNVFKPFIIILNTVGLHMPMERGTVANAISIVYCVISQLLIWITLCRYFIPYTDEIQTVGSLAATLSYAGFQVSGTYVCIATCVTINKHLPKFFKKYNSYREKYSSAVDNVTLRRTMKLFLILAASLNIILAPFLYFMSLHRVHIGVIYLRPIKLLPPEYFPAAKAVFFIVFQVVVSQAALTLAFFTFLTYCLFKEFKQLNVELSTLFQKNEGTASTMCIERIRRQFEDTCSLVDTINKVFMHMIGSAYFALVPIICLILYVFIHAESMTKEYSMLITCILFSTAVVAASLYTSVVLNIKAHSSLMYLLVADFPELSDKDLHIIHIFITRLTTTKIGYTIYSLFTIDSSTILMLLGTLVTYVEVILQF
ncbi:uncharacterized protein [Haliotis asinina]|uniref:uncharacterized protein n=1 Tax=Haliotis asinina TaxID=109174 RepID=UPI0035319460